MTSPPRYKRNEIVPRLAPNLRRAALQMPTAGRESKRNSLPSTRSSRTCIDGSPVVRASAARNLAIVMDEQIPTLTCPECGVLLRDGTDALVCPEHGTIEPYPDVQMPPAFEGPDLDELRQQPSPRSHDI